MSAFTALLMAALLALCAGCRATSKAAWSQPSNWQDPDHLGSASELLSQHGIAATRDVQQKGATARITNAHEQLPAPDKAAANVTTPIVAKGLVALRDWCAQNSLTPPRRSANGPFGFLVAGQQGVISMVPGNTVAKWNGADVHLGYPPEVIADQIYVQAADLRSTIQPLLLPEVALARSARTIVLDPGHGGIDSGARSIFGLEKQFTLDWGLRLGYLLQRDGWRVFMTRSTDVDTSLSNRVATAESVNADLFVSLHFNSAAPDKSGIETYCLTPAGVGSTLTRGYPDELDLVLPNNTFDAQNLQLALLLHQALLPVNGGRDRGVRRARFPAVLRTQNRPAVLLEGGFLSNDQEARLIATAQHRQRLAEAAAAALRSILAQDAFTGGNSRPNSASPNP